VELKSKFQFIGFKVLNFKILMMDNNDIRWIQRFSNFKKALQKLQEAVEEYRNEGMNEIEKEGLIQRFEYTYELAWNTIKDFYEEQGEISIQGSKDAFRTAFSRVLPAMVKHGWR